MGERQTLTKTMPRPLAEYMEPSFVTSEMKHYETRRNPEGLFRSAWNHAEFGLNKNVACDDVVRKYYFEHAQYLLGRTLDHPDVHQDVRLGALVLSSYMALFQKRSTDQHIGAEDCYDIYMSLGKAMSYLQPLEVDRSPQWRMAETAVLALSARTLQPDLLLYPASPREEASLESSLNHDSYFYTPEEKIPIQQKLIQTDKEYDEWITILTLQPLVEKGLRRARAAQPVALVDQVNLLFALIVADTNGEELAKDEKSFLDYLSQAVVAHRPRQLTRMVA